MKTFRASVSKLVLAVSLSHLTMQAACLAQPQTLPSYSQAVEQSATGTGVVYPEKNTGERRQQPVDKLPETERSQAEKERLSQVQFTVDPRTQIQKFLSTLKLPNERPILARGNLNYIESDALIRMFPNSVFYVLRFPQWPLAIEPPQPLGNNNIFVISKEAKGITLITDKNKEQCKQFLITKLPHSQSDQKAIQAVKAALTLMKELYQDGMFGFENEAKAIYATKNDGITHAGGTLSVIPQGGNSGSISVNITFDANGAASEIKCESNLREGMRPICQSTKLLDPDPIVRKMAEQDILIMGSSAKEYLNWQREQVSPELRQAIDQIWERIIREGR